MYLIIWEYRIKPGCEGAFEKDYGADGVWVRFFQKGAGYIKTTLHKNLEKERSYFTFDYWDSEQRYKEFSQAHADEYAAIDRACDELTEIEVKHGACDISE